MNGLKADVRSNIPPKECLAAEEGVSLICLALIRVLHLQLKIKQIISLHIAISVVKEADLVRQRSMEQNFIASSLSPSLCGRDL